MWARFGAASAEPHVRKSETRSAPTNDQTPTITCEADCFGWTTNARKKSILPRSGKKPFKQVLVKPNKFVFLESSLSESPRPTNCSRAEYFGARIAFKVDRLS